MPLTLIRVCAISHTSLLLIFPTTEKIQTISSGCHLEQLGSGILLGLNKRARAPTRRVYFASIIIWQEPMAEFFQTVHLREEFFPLISPRVAAVRVHRQIVYTCKIHSWEAGPWLSCGAARCSPRARSRTCCLCGPSAALKPSTPNSRPGTPNLQTPGPLGLWWQGLGRNPPPCKTPQNKSEVAGDSHPGMEPGVRFSSLKTTGKLFLKYIFTAFQNQRENRKKKKQLTPACHSTIFWASF